MIEKKRIDRCKKIIAESDTILIGAGAGLSTAAGLEYSGKRFTDNFADFIKKYQLTDMYSTAFYPFPTLEEKWAYFSRHIKLNRYDAEVGQIYFDLLKLVKDKNYFVLTTNGDSLFFRAGFAPDKIFATQGDYSKFQCEKACHDRLYDNEEIVKQMVQQQSDFRIPSELVPKCPVCGRNLVAHLRMDGNFVENNDWHAASQRYLDFVKQAKDKKLLLLELGVGFNTPSIIRWPFEQITNAYSDSTLIRVNRDKVQATYAMPDRNVLLKIDIADFFEAILK